VLNAQSEVLSNIFIITLLTALFGDIVLRSLWNKLYFSVGLPIFILIMPVQTQYKGVPFQYLFEEEHQSGWFTPLLFKQIGMHIYAFREKYFSLGFNYFPIMHGVLIFDDDQQRVVVKGIANWFTIWLIIYFLLVWTNLVATFPIQITGSVAFLVFVFVICYLIQYSRFMKVGKLAAELCSKSHFLNSAGV
jgi:hypothetical protein